MSRGLVVKDRDTGRVLIDTSTILPNQLGTVDVGGVGSAATGSVYNPLLGQGTPYYVIIYGPINFVREQTFPYVWFDGLYIKWSFPHPSNQFEYQRPSCRILYGIT